MPYKDPKDPRRKESLRKGSAKYYSKNKEKVKKLTNRNKILLRERWIEFKSSKKCRYCGAAHPAIIDFHHVIRDNTKIKVHYLVRNGQYQRAMEEVKKCIPLCANCHRIHHWEERRAKERLRKKKNPAR